MSKKSGRNVRKGLKNWNVSIHEDFSLSKYTKIKKIVLSMSSSK